MEQIETPKQYNMSFTQDELNMIIASLSELPFKVSQPLISKMIKDFAEITAAEPAAQPVAE
jgi:hypothetical protein